MVLQYSESRTQYYLWVDHIGHDHRPYQPQMISATDNDNIVHVQCRPTHEAQISLHDRHMFIMLCMNICVA